MPAKTNLRLMKPATEKRAVTRRLRKLGFLTGDDGVVFPAAAGNGSAAA